MDGRYLLARSLVVLLPCKGKVGGSGEEQGYSPCQRDIQQLEGFTLYCYLFLAKSEPNAKI